MIDPSWAKGIDVSHWKRVQNFAAIPADVVMFGAKASEDAGIIDATLSYHRDGARARGFDLVKYFHVARPGDPSQQAQHAAGVVGPLESNECIVLDCERSSGVDVPFIEGFYAELEQLGLGRPFDLWYGSVGSWPAGKGWPRAANGKVALWAPRYKSAGQPPHLPAPWAGWAIHQWTDGGATGDPYSCPGVGECDANVFNGARDRLQAFVAGTC
jgi:GH25 family lysozyme M1 (1,4-beta-N-acetylmuramidase)